MSVEIEPLELSFRRMLATPSLVSIRTLYVRNTADGLAVYRALHRRGLADLEDQKPELIAFGFQGMELCKYATFSFSLQLSALTCSCLWIPPVSS